MIFDPLVFSDGNIPSNLDDDLLEDPDYDDFTEQSQQDQTNDDFDDSSDDETDANETIASVGGPIRNVEY